MMKSDSFRVWSQMEPISADEALSLAVQVGYRGWGRVSPNPLVGCVIVDRNQRLLSSGAHLQLGGPHAEVEALTSLSDPKLLDGAWVYVTLEPCAHEGRTPACAKTLANLPIAGVTYLVEDPNPLVAGKGAAILRAAGKQVVHQLRESTEAELLAEVFLTNMRLRRPFVALRSPPP